MRKHLLWLIVLAAPAYGQTAAYNDWCNQGATQVSTQGLLSSNVMQGESPLCTVTVYLTGTTTLATIYKDANNTPLSNPFSASSNGQILFYAAENACYDVVRNPGVTTTGVNCGLGGGSGGSGTVTSAGFTSSVPGITLTGTNPITTSGTVNIGQTAYFDVAQGGTGAGTAKAAIQNLLPAYVSGYILTNNGPSSGNLSWLSCPLCATTALYYQTVLVNLVAQTQRPNLGLSSLFSCSDSLANQATLCTLAGTGVTAGTYSNVTVTVTSTGQISSISSASVTPLTCNTNSGGYGCYEVDSSGLIREEFATGSLNNNTPTQITIPFPWPTRLIGINCSDNGTRVFDGNNQPVGASAPNSSGGCSGSSSPTSPSSTVCLNTPATSVSAYCHLEAQ